MSDLIVRASTEADVARCAEIYAHHVLHGTASFEVDPPDLAEMARRRAAVLDLGLPHLVAERGGRVVSVRREPPRPADTSTLVFAKDKPFLDGVHATPEGEVWVLRTRPAGDSIPRYDVFDRQGNLERQVALNPSSKVFAFGRGTVYVLRTDADDLQHLQRFTR